MVMDGRGKRVVLAAALAMVAAAGMGCDGAVLASHAISAGAGWLIGRTTTPIEVETRCFRDGEEVDCAELPD